MTQNNKTSAITEIMVVNDSPGDECRIAVLQEGHLEELFTEREATATNVGNIYKGRVTNVESAIQAAFIDFGQLKNGFLHISDLHPQYFPGQERTEQVGKKIPRRSRPLIQNALKRGQEVLVQVLKEGIGTKGPTLTSYLSIPGRFMVMMPYMDRVGVSRRIEDEDKRREMRKVLDSLDLPEGFGFILRTAGFDVPKTELKRDLSYMTRLWKVMEQRIRNAGTPCELYTESDLLIRTIRDVLRPSIKTIVVDSEAAYDRISQFLKVVAPRTAPRVLRFTESIPIFHAFDLEHQIELIHSRSVPLKSGGQIVIDQTEALVAIDVNSGKSRSAQDSETNAYQTNSEAADEICRQLRLRDMGGLIINDLIDMRSPRHRREIEDRFRQNLKRDRAKTTTLRLSQFGILEMTRQRMRPSLRMSHFVPCTACSGHGEVKSPDIVGMDATRQLGYLLQQDRIQRVEMVCSPRVASVLLSDRRREMVRLESITNKKIDVRVSEAIATDRVDFYAYDDRNSVIDLEKLPILQPPSLTKIEKMMKEADAVQAKPTMDGESKEGRSRRRRRRKTGPANASDIALSTAFVEEHEEPEKKPVSQNARQRRDRKKPDPETQPVESRSEQPDRRPAPKSKISTRVHILAKELGQLSRDILARCREDGRITVKNHMSSVTSDNADLIRNWFAAQEQVEQPPEKEATPTRRRRRGKRGGRRRRKVEANVVGEVKSEESVGESDATPTEDPSRRRARAPRKRRRKTEPVVESKPTVADGESVVETSVTVKKKKRRGRRKRSAASVRSEYDATSNNDRAETTSDSTGSTDAMPTVTVDQDAAGKSRKRRTLYSRRVSVSTAAREEAEKTS